ncbi:FCD domain-containing protein [Streptomyces sp. DSM 44917]|uniref:FCD domain-containing protein n=1 Tax=Streptomyces boetiae TaxID=3075541 RepID=A0ABU2L7I9_9ACTN|nr:FCD domain-containing protein [Streptomyces sp. DSM 44917]MDT0307534.1 FCD domain-containing protein [Streptomyces sp. DSM 44917]
MLVKEGIPTRVDEVYAGLRADILAGRLTPGTRLKFAELRGRYSTNVGATREALARLAAEGLVTSAPHQGYRVVSLSHADLADLAEARAGMETQVLRLSVRDGDMAWEAALVAAFHVLERTRLIGPDDPDRPSDAWNAAHAAFHDALLRGCRNRRLLTMARALRQEGELYRQWSVSLGGRARERATADHRELLEPALARDADLAAERLGAHIRDTARLLISCATDAPAEEER